MNTTQAIDLITAKANELCHGWTVDDDNRQVVTTAAAWLAREPRQGMDLNKGLLILGNVGTGKTLLLRALRSAMLEAYGAQFGIRSCSELVRAFTDDGYEAIENWLSAPHVCFDDLGTEGEGVHYGKRTNLMAEVIEGRYERLSAGRKCWTHITTNLGTDQIEARYGARATSRLRQMCNLLDLGASSLARDRRANAEGIAPPVQQENPDNIYTSMHPKVAERLRIAIGPAVEAAQAITRQRLQVVRSGPLATQEDHLTKFSATIMEMSDGELRTLRVRVEKENKAEAAAPYLKVIDSELEARKEPVEEEAPLNSQTTPAA